MFFVPKCNQIISTVFSQQNIQNWTKLNWKFQHICGFQLPTVIMAMCLPVQPQDHEWGQALMLSLALAVFRMLQFVPKVLDGVEVSAHCRPVKFFTTKWKHGFLVMCLAQCTRAPSCWNALNCCQKVESTCLSGISLDAGWRWDLI